MKGAGASGKNGGPNGDVYVKIRVEIKTQVHFDKLNIYYNVPITPFEAALGEEITIPNIKIGTGNAYLADLAFIDQYVLDQLKNHIEDMERHITDEERMRWNNKINITQSVQGETLVFDRN